MKRSSLPFLLAAIIAVALGFSVKHDPSPDHQAFEARFRDALRAAEFHILTEASLNAEEVSLPLMIHWHPRRWRGPSTDPLIAGFPDCTIRYAGGRSGAGKVDCYVRYLDGRAQIIEIRPDREAPMESSMLCRALRARFADVPVRVKGE